MNDQILTVALFVTPLVLAWVGWSAKKWVETVFADMNAKIEQRTYPIQPNANGGKSLPDANDKLDVIEDKIDTLHGRITDLARDVSHLTGRFDEHIRSGA